MVLGMGKYLMIMHALQKHFHDETFEVIGDLLRCGNCEFHILKTYRDTYYLAFKEFLC